MKKYIFSIAACILLLGGLLGFYFINKDRQGDPPPEPTPTDIALLTRSASDAVSFELEKPDGHMTYVRNEDGSWSMRDVAAPLSQSLMRGIIDSICALSVAEKAEDALNNAPEYGFEPPSSSLTVHFKDGSSETIHIGSRTPDNNFHYIMLDGDPALYLIRYTMGALFNLHATDLLDRGLPAIESADSLTHILIQTPNQLPIEAFADLDSYDPSMQSAELYQIYMTSPVDGKRLHTNSFMTKVLSPLSAIALGSYVAEATSDNLAAYGFGSPAYDITLENNSTLYRLVVGNFFGDTNEFAYATYIDLPYIFEIDAAPIKELARLTAFDFMDSLVSVFNIDYVDSISIEPSSGQTFEFTLTHTFVQGNGLTVADHNQIAATLNGKSMSERDFRAMYANILLISYNATLNEYTPSSDPALTVTFKMTDGTGSFTDVYYDYDVNFYAINKEGLGAFLVNKAYVHTVLDALNTAESGL